MRNLMLAAGLYACSILPAPPVHAEPPPVVASIKPVHALAAAVMAGVGQPDLLLAGAASPHGFSLKPSAARALQAAAVVLWVGPGLETFLVRPLGTMARDARVVTLSEAPGVELLRHRELAFHGGQGDADQEAGEHGREAAHDHGAYDLHVWLDPDNARAMAAAIAAVLSEADPARAQRYQRNLARLQAAIDELDRAVAARLASVRDRPFLVFHDAYQYFVRHYGLNELAAIAISPERPAGARWLGRVRARLEEIGPTCLFTEPSFAPDLVTTLAAEKTLVGSLDPLGATIEPGPELYQELMMGLASSLAGCLAQLP